MMKEGNFSWKKLFTKAVCFCIDLIMASTLFLMSSLLKMKHFPSLIFK